MTLIKIIAIDIDGCLTAGEVKPIDYAAFGLLKKYNHQSKTQKQIPAITICSGRPQPYVEGIMQMIDGYLPGIYESGGGLYFPQSYQFFINPEISQRTKKHVEKLKQIFQKEIVQKNIAKLQPGKEVSFSLFPCRGTSLKSLSIRVRKILNKNSFNFQLVDARSCINIFIPGIDKGTGIRWFSRVTGISLAEIAGIGDSLSDIPLLKVVGFSAAPANAIAAVKSVVQYVSPYKDAKGVVDILKRCAENNLHYLKKSF